MSQTYNIIIIGGGAAGFFAAINIKDKQPKLRVAILEKGVEVLTKVRISGGGRCNVTNACKDASAFVKHYPRGEKELRGPFQTFSNLDTMQWFEKRGVPLKTQPDGRVFPKSDQSESIIHCFLKEAENHKINILTQQTVKNIQKNDKLHTWKITTDKETFVSDRLVITTGSNHKMWQLIENLGHTIIPPTPSLFSFHIKDPNLHAMMGIAHKVSVRINGSNLQSDGNMLITHWGLSGPAILKLSAWGSKFLAEKKYQFDLIVNWLPEKKYQQVLEELNQNKKIIPKRNILKNASFGFTQRLWEYIVRRADISDTLKYAEISKAALQNLASQISEATFYVTGKSTFKDEFVTAGGVSLKEIHFKTMESKLLENLYFAGEVLDIDAITGGFNFQNAWTGAWIISENIGKAKPFATN